ncbi:ATP-binding cassette domain-containing protein, partial [Aquabacterium sp.]|uniref:ATP-binding cassette domain-containing protein n=1 Tax=Aquabacterium sp. TaxID=1872578 RepID=UPI0025C6BDD8
FQFTGDMVNQPVGQFSGGEKARLVLALVVWQRPNLLLLDEPTNHLDLTTREALSMALNEFEGSVMLVSHDRALLREVCDEFWLVAHGEVTTFDGDLDDYQRWLQAQAREVAAAAKAARDADRVTPARSAPVQIQPEVAPTSNRDDRKAQAQARQKLTEQVKPLKADLKKLDERLAKAHAEQAALTESLGHPGLSASDRAEQGKRLKTLGEEVDKLEARWLELTDQIEKLTL